MPADKRAKAFVAFALTYNVVTPTARIVVCSLRKIAGHWTHIKIHSSFVFLYLAKS